MNIPLDKQAHLWWGFCIAVSVGLLTIPLVGLLAAAVVGALKEGYDYYHPLTHTCEFNDWLATTLGGVVATAFLLGVAR